jgi:hypothetical protein
LMFVYEQNSCIEVLEVLFAHKQYKIESKVTLNLKQSSNPFI